MINIPKELRKAIASRIQTETGLILGTIPRKELPFLYLTDTNIQTEDSQTKGSIDLVYVGEFSNEAELDSLTDKSNEIITALHRSEAELKAIESLLDIVTIWVSRYNETFLYEEGGNKSFGVYELTFSFIGNLIPR